MDGNRDETAAADQAVDDTKFEMDASCNALGSLGLDASGKAIVLQSPPFDIQGGASRRTWRVGVALRRTLAGPQDVQQSRQRVRVTAQHELNVFNHKTSCPFLDRCPLGNDWAAAKGPGAPSVRQLL